MKKLYLVIVFILLISFISKAQIINTIAGMGNAGYSGDGGLATVATFNQPVGITTDVAGNVYVADAGNNVIRKISTSGIITTVAGNGFGAGVGALYNNTIRGGYSGDGGQATLAELSCPYDVAVDATGNIYIADAANNVIRKVNTLGIISTVAGTHTAGNSGNYGYATAANLNFPEGVAVDGVGNIYISDAGNDIIREVTTAGIIKKIAGGGTHFPGNGYLATLDVISNPMGIEVDLTSSKSNQLIDEIFTVKQMLLS